MPSRPLTTEHATQIADEIVRLYRDRGQEQYGEALTQLQHAWQTAALARAAGYDEAVYLGAFLHDIGHFLDNAERMGEFGVASHEQVGRDYLAHRGFSDTVLALVAGHVAAKRYLCYRNPAYYAQLSAASKATLAYQGGPMTAAEADAFGRHPLFELCIQLRTWDDRGKDPDLATGSLDTIRDGIIRHLTHPAAPFPPPQNNHT